MAITSAKAKETLPAFFVSKSSLAIQGVLNLIGMGIFIYCLFLNISNNHGWLRTGGSILFIAFFAWGLMLVAYRYGKYHGSLQI